MGEYLYFLKGVDFYKNGKLLWHQDLPERMRIRHCQRSMQKIDINKLSNPDFLSGGVLSMEKIIAISDRSGLLFLNRETGKIIQDRKMIGNDKIYFDRGTYSITFNGEICTGGTKTGPCFLSETKNYIYHFDGFRLSIFNKSDFQIARQLWYDKNKFSLLEGVIFPAIGVCFRDEALDFILEGIVFLE
jgi:hypothetical protein